MFIYNTDRFCSCTVTPQIAHDAQLHQEETEKTGATVPHALAIALTLVSDDEDLTLIPDDKHQVRNTGELASQQVLPVNEVAQRSSCQPEAFIRQEHK